MRTGRRNRGTTGPRRPRASLGSVSRFTFHVSRITHHVSRFTSAFTLIELVISVTLMALILGASYACMSAAIAGKKIIEPRADVIQNARVAMSMISADLRSACPLSKDFE